MAGVFAFTIAIVCFVLMGSDLDFRLGGAVW
jgi:hypothetical protein